LAEEAALIINDNTIEHLETLFELKSLKGENLNNSLHKKIDISGKKINKFIQSVEKEHQS